MSKQPLGFGMMRLPVVNGDSTKIDFEKLNPMVDAFLEAGYTYFDTSYVYHGGMSEDATRKAVVERHSRDSFTVATKFPAFAIQSEAEVEPVFAKQLQNLGVEVIDYYLLHNLQTLRYDGVDGKGGIVKTARLFEHLKQWKKDGKVRHIGFSFHSSAKLLDRILTEHPEVEFVQLAVNYYDWEAELVQAKACCDVLKKHGKQLVIMEPVKGGLLARLPAQAEAMLKEQIPAASIASWAFRFLASQQYDVLAVLSGMTTMAQVKDNTSAMQDMPALTGEQMTVLAKALRILKDSAPVDVATIEKFRGVMFHGVPVTALLQVYSSCQIQPVPTFACDLNYPVNVFAENAHLDFANANLTAETITLPDGTDGTEIFAEALAWLKAHHF